MVSENWFDKLMPLSPQECRQNFYNDGLGEIAIGFVLSLVSFGMLLLSLKWVQRNFLHFMGVYLCSGIIPGIVLGYVVKSIRRRLWLREDGVKEYYAAIEEHEPRWVGCIIPFLAPLAFFTISMLDIDWIGAGANIDVVRAGGSALFWGLLQGFNHRKWRYGIIGVLAQVLAMFMHLLIPDNALDQGAIWLLIVGIGLLYMGLFQFIRFLKQTVLAEE